MWHMLEAEEADGSRPSTPVEVSTVWLIGGDDGSPHYQVRLLTGNEAWGMTHDALSWISVVRFLQIFIGGNWPSDPFHSPRARCALSLIILSAVTWWSYIAGMLNIIVLELYVSCNYIQSNLKLFNIRNTSLWKYTCVCTWNLSTYLLWNYCLLEYT
jgi:hypothetical protein